MIVKLTQAAAITAALYLLMGLNYVETGAKGKTIEPPEALVALKQALVHR